MQENSMYFEVFTEKYKFFIQNSDNSGIIQKEIDFHEEMETRHWSQKEIKDYHLNIFSKICKTFQTLDLWCIISYLLVLLNKQTLHNLSRR